MGPLVLRGGRVLTPSGLVDADVWVEDGVVSRLAPHSPPSPDAARPASGVRVIDVTGRLVSPAFVDAHVHLVATGLAMAGADLSAARTKDEALAILAAQPAEEEDPVSVLLGHGWDETRWPGGASFTRAELDRVVGDRPAYVSRVDVHSAVVSTALLTLLDRPDTRGAHGGHSGHLGDDAHGGTMPTGAQLAGLDGWSDQGPLTRDAHHAVRGAYHRLVPSCTREAAMVRALAHAARVGVGTVHELGAPHLSVVDDGLLAASLTGPATTGPATTSRRLPDVVPYWGERASLARNLEHGWGAAGDICVDGAVGSRTAALHEPYADAPGTAGHLYLSVEEVADHVIACTEVGIQAGFHSIGDRSVTTTVDGLRLAAARLGADPVRDARHRLEHVEMITPEQVEVLAELGVTASVQPVFDRWWGGPGNLYEQRLGDRWRGMNPYRTLLDGGVTLALGSDSPVTPISPWAAVRAAVGHHDPDEQITLEEALAAHTSGGWAAARRHGGTIEPGAPAHLAVWDQGLDHLEQRGHLGQDDPRCLLTLVAGDIAHEEGLG